MNRDCISTLIAILVISTILVGSPVVAAQSSYHASNIVTGEADVNLPPDNSSMDTPKSVSLGDWGTSFSYIETFGYTQKAYFDETTHLNFPVGKSVEQNDNVYEPEFEVYLPLVLRNLQFPIASTWEEITSPTSENLNSLDMISEDNGWSVGAGGSILHWNGTNWTAFSSPTTIELNSIDLLDVNTGWAVGQGGTILNWNGTIWRNVASPTIIEINDVEIISSNNVWAVGVDGTILHWNGFVWESVSSPTTYDLFAIDFVSPNDGWAVGGEWNTQIGWYESVYLHWNGSLWSNYLPVQVLDVFEDIDMVTSTYGIAVGSNNAKSFWNGISWNSSYTIPMMHYSAVDFLTDNDGWAVGSVYQDNNIQHWNGSNWTSVACPTELRLNDVFLINSTTGWSVGQGGTILRYGP